MGLAIGYSVLMSVPVVGANLAELIWNGPFPGTQAFWSRMYVAHVFLLPILIGTLIGLHLVLVAARHHAQFRGPRRTERKVVGIPTFPGYTPRTLGLLCAVTAVLFLLGGLVQINPIWLWGPYHVADGTNGAQPDWYLGWLIGALRLMPAFDVTIGHYTLIPNPFWGGALFPMLVFGFLFAWPFLERRFTGDYSFHNLLDRPRDAPNRTAAGAAILTCILVVLLAGSSDRVFILLNISYGQQIWVYRVLVWALPIVVFFVTRRVCNELRRGELVEHDREHAEEEARAAAAEASA
jgi:ubiquinol-cytochrome c reductase cytochrome b subunit